MMHSSSLIKKVDSELVKELTRFLITGGGAVVTDLLGYVLLQQLVDYNTAKAISFCMGSVVAYILNNFWTFKTASVSRANVLKFVTLYLFTFVCNVVANSAVFSLLSSLCFAFLVATGVSTVLNYLGQKFWVFKK